MLPRLRRLLPLPHRRRSRKTDWKPQTRRSKERRAFFLQSRSAELRFGTLECGDSSPLLAAGRLVAQPTPRPAGRRARGRRRNLNKQRAGKAATSPAPYTHLQSQRDCVFQPRVARDELPWVMAGMKSATPTGLWPRGPAGTAATPLGLATSVRCSQGSSCLATLGFGRNPFGIRPLRPQFADAYKEESGTSSSFCSPKNCLARLSFFPFE